MPNTSLPGETLFGKVRLLFFGSFTAVVLKQED